MGLYLASWRARGHGHQLAGKAASALGGVVAMGTGYLGGHLSFVLGAGRGERGRLSAAIALPEHAGDPQPTNSAEGDVVSGDNRPVTSVVDMGVGPSTSARSAPTAPMERRATTTDSWTTVEVVTPAVTDDQRRELQQLPHHMAEVTEPSNLPPTSDEMHTAFRFAPDELTLESLRALSAEASRIAGAARLLYRQDDPNVVQLVDKANSG
jgi:hypothetical protein